MAHRTNPKSIGSFLLLCTMSLWCGCSDDESTTGPSDSTPPSGVTTLSAGSATDSSVTLTWTAVGDDGNAGTASSYDLRYSAAAISEGNISGATPVAGVPIPRAAGQQETFTVTGLAAGTTYFFALRVGDEASNWSPLSNVASRATDGQTLPPLPTVASLMPARTLVGDTLVVQGTGFGDVQDSSAVLFTGSALLTGSASAIGVASAIEATVLAGGWSATSIRVLVPAGVVEGPVAVRREGRTGPGVSFQVAPPMPVSFTSDLLPLFGIRGCISCHGGTNGLFLGSRAALLEGNSVHGPVVIRRNGPASLIVKKVRGTAGFGERMPPGGQLTEEEILLISDWIDQGTRDN